MTQTVPATAVLGPAQTGLAIGYRVLNLDGTVYSAFSTVGVAETDVLGTYRVAAGVVLPDAGGYIVFGTAATDYAETNVESVGDQQTILDRLGAFTGSGYNTVLGFFQALMRANASLPSDAGGTYNPATDSIEAIRNILNSAAVTVVSQAEGTAWTIYRTSVFTAPIENLTIPAGWAKALLTLKRSKKQTDAEAEWQIQDSVSGSGDGLLVIAGEEASDASLATLAIDEVGESAAVLVKGAATALLEDGAGLVWDIKFILDDGTASAPTQAGTAKIETPVTLSMS